MFDHRVTVNEVHSTFPERKVTAISDYISEPFVFLGGSPYIQQDYGG
jgi:hypothetical protein